MKRFKGFKNSLSIRSKCIETDLKKQTKKKKKKKTFYVIALQKENTFQS